MNIALGESVDIRQKVFLAKCVIGKGLKSENNLWSAVMILKEVLDHPEPQLSSNNGGLFNLVRNDADSGGHYPEISAKEVKDYIRQKITDRVEALEAEGINPAIVPQSYINKEIAEEYIANVQAGVKSLVNKFKRILSDNKENLAIISAVTAVTAAGLGMVYRYSLFRKEVDEENYFKVLAELDKLWVDLNVKNNDGKTALHWAAWSGDTDIVKALAVAGADINAKDNNGKTALHWSAWRGHTDIVKGLAVAGADINAKDKYGDTVLHYAASNGHTDVVKALVAAGADLNVKDNDGKTVLHSAIDNGLTDVVKALVAAGADLNVKDNDGKTALDIAMQHKRDDIAQLLTESQIKSGAKNNGGEVRSQLDVDNQASESLIDKANQFIKQYDPLKFPGAEGAALSSSLPAVKSWQDLVVNNRLPEAPGHRQVLSGNNSSALSAPLQAPEVALMGVAGALAAKFIGRTGATKPRNHVEKLDASIQKSSIAQKEVLEMHEMSEVYAKAARYIETALAAKPGDQDLIKLDERAKKINELSEGIRAAFDKGEFSPETTEMMNKLSKKQAGFMKKYNAITSGSHADKISNEKPATNGLNV